MPKRPTGERALTPNERSQSRRQRHAEYVTALEQAVADAAVEGVDDWYIRHAETIARAQANARK